MEITVFNVGQGDAIALEPRECKFENSIFQFDLGDGSRDVLGELNVEKNIHILLTHAHHDHIGGLLNVQKHNNNIKSVYLPCCYSEIILVGELLTRLKNAGPFCGAMGRFSFLFNSFAISNVLRRINELSNASLEMCYDSKKLCQHIEILNPPINPLEYFNVNENQCDTILEEIQSETRTWFEDSDYSEIRGTILTEGWSYRNRQVFPNVPGYSFPEKIKFINLFLYFLRKKIINFLRHPTENNLASVFEEYKMYSNRSSIVFQYKNANYSALFTGDADIYVFNRLIRKGSLRNNMVLKVPHHGSKKNLNKKVLSLISPMVSIISHGNGRFGKQKDPHPSIEVLKMHSDLNIDLVMTNPAIKKGILFQHNTKSWKNLISIK